MLGTASLIIRVLTPASTDTVVIAKTVQQLVDRD
jgi:hypothetical protein